jgi:hypothetical protein
MVMPDSVSKTPVKPDFPRVIDASILRRWSRGETDGRWLLPANAPIA